MKWRNRKHSAAKACFLTQNRLSGDLNEKSQQEDKRGLPQDKLYHAAIEPYMTSAKGFSPPGLCDGW